MILLIIIAMLTNNTGFKPGFSYSDSQNSSRDQSNLETYWLACWSENSYCWPNVSVNSNWVHPPRATPGKIFLSERIPATRAKFFCLIPCPGAKNDGQIPRGWGKIFPSSKKLPLKHAKNPQEIQKTTRQYKFFVRRT